MKASHSEYLTISDPIFGSEFPRLWLSSAKGPCFGSWIMCFSRSQCPIVSVSSRNDRSFAGFFSPGAFLKWVLEGPPCVSAHCCEHPTDASLLEMSNPSALLGVGVIQCHLSGCFFPRFAFCQFRPLLLMLSGAESCTNVRAVLAV